MSLAIPLASLGAPLSLTLTPTTTKTKDEVEEGEPATTRSKDIQLDLFLGVILLRM